MNPIAGPIVAWIVLGVTIAAGGFGFYGGYRWAEAGVVKCELKAEKKEVAQVTANVTETKRQTTASNRAARGLESDRNALQTQFNEVRNEQTEAALAQPDRANVVCFDDEWLRLDAAATRAANERGADRAGPPKALPAPARTDQGNSGEPAAQPNAARRAVRRLFGDSPAPGAVDPAPRSPEKN